MRTESAFVVDSQGFVIASHGQLSSQDFDGLGAELSLALEQLGSIDALALRGGLLSAELDFGARKVIGFRGAVGREEFVLGFVAVEPIESATRTAVATSFRDVLPRLA